VSQQEPNIEPPRQGSRFDHLGLRATAVPGLESLVHCFADEVGADAALVALWEPGRAEARIAAGWELERYGAPRLRRGRGTLGRLAKSRVAVSAPLSEWTGDPRDELAPRIVHAAAASVLSPQGRRGAICAGFTQSPELERDPLLWTVGYYAAVASLCLNRSSGLGHLIEASSHDGLTGCLSYPGVMKALNEEINRCQRHGGGFSCCYFHLGPGERAGIDGLLHRNRLLTVVGEALADGLRSYDSVGRFRARGFVLVLPGTEPETAVELGERLRRRAREWVEASIGESIDAAVGISSWAEGRTASDLVEAAEAVARAALHTRVGVAIAETEQD
jgi:GGDEF domain-containing protein